MREQLGCNEEIVQFLWNNDGNIGDFCYFCKA